MGFDRVHFSKERILRGRTDLSLRWRECYLHRLGRFSLNPDNNVSMLTNASRSIPCIIVLKRRIVGTEPAGARRSGW